MTLAYILYNDVIMTPENVLQKTDNLVIRNDAPWLIFRILTFVLWTFSLDGNDEAIMMLEYTIKTQIPVGIWVFFYLHRNENKSKIIKMIEMFSHLVI